MVDSEPQDTLLNRLRARDHAAQAALRRSEQVTLERLVARTLGSAAEAKPLVADLFADFFWKHVDQVRTARAIPAYLRIMAIRRARRLRARQSLMVELCEEGTAATNPVPVDDAVDRRLHLTWLSECLQRLSARARLVLKLHYGDDLSYSEVGAYQSCSKQAVGKVVAKSLEALRRCIETQAEATALRADPRASP